MSDRFGASEQDCPLCGADADDLGPVPAHIRRDCPVAERIRVEEMDLPEEGFGADPDRPGADQPHEHVDRDPETGYFVPRGETA